MKLTTRLRGLEASMGDALLGVSTLGILRGEYPEAQSANDDSFWYESKSYYLNWLYLRPLKLRRDDVVFDIGCGAGRLLFVAALCGVRRCIGIELSAKLCRLASENAGKLRLSHTPVEIHQADASKADYSEGTVFLFCNPFGAKTLDTVFSQIRRSLAVNPRTVRVIYIHPQPDHDEYFPTCSWLRKTGESMPPGSRNVPALYFTIGPEAALRDG